MEHVWAIKNIENTFLIIYFQDHIKGKHATCALPVEAFSQNSANEKLLVKVIKNEIKKSSDQHKPMRRQTIAMSVCEQKWQRLVQWNLKWLYNDLYTIQTRSIK